jgi:hypothetical protein
LQLNPLLQLGEVKLDHPPQRKVRPVQAIPNLLQGKLKVLERFDLLQAHDVTGGVETMPRVGAPGRREQADLIVVVKSAHG